MQKFTSAIVTLNEPKVKNYVKTHEIADPEVLLKAIKEDLESFKHTKEYKNQFPEKWIPVTFQIADEPFSEQNHQINSSMKMVRHQIQLDYRNRLDFMYSSSGTNIVNPLNVEAIQKYLPFN